MTARFHVISVYRGNYKALEIFPEKIKQAIKRVPSKIVKPLINEAHEVAWNLIEKNKWSGGLLSALSAPIISKSGKSGKIFINDSKTIVAQVNEFGTPRRYLPFKAFPQLKEWAEVKAPQLADGEGITIGNESGRIALGNPKNSFWNKTQKFMDRRISPHIEKQMSKELKRI